MVNNVAQCVQCHTPRNSVGDIDRMRLLQGAPIPFESPWPRQEWAVRAPHIAGLPGFRDADIVRLLTTGSRADGRKPSPPMPSYRLTREDAEAVVAYLRSLP
jgi:mono/diheme cytochrome c family protein